MSKVEVTVELVYPDGKVELRPVNRGMFTRLRRAAKALQVYETTEVRGVKITRLT